MADFEPKIATALAPFFVLMSMKSMWWLGNPGVGKSPLAKAFSLCHARQYHNGEDPFMPRLV